jgi:hypothetical protein
LFTNILVIFGLLKTKPEAPDSSREYNQNIRHHDTCKHLYDLTVFFSITFPGIHGETYDHAGVFTGDDGRQFTLPNRKAFNLIVAICPHSHTSAKQSCRAPCSVNTKNSV